MTIELTESQRLKLHSVAIKWTPDTAHDCVQFLLVAGLPVYSLTVDNPRKSSRDFRFLGFSSWTFCGVGGAVRKGLTLEEFIVYLYTEVLM